MIKPNSGIDISAWETNVLWEKLAPRPSLVIAKASEYKWRDTAFVMHYQNAEEYPRGAYHFYRPDDIPAQVETFLWACEEAGAFVGGKWLAEIAPIFDAEYAPPKTPRKKPKNYKEPPIGAALAYQYKTWLDLVEQRTGVKPIIYTSQYYWSFTLACLGRVPSWTRDYPLWLAYYPDRPDDFPEPTAGMLPRGWELSDVIMWQYDEAGRLAGVPYDGVDLNWVKPEYLASLGATPEPTHPFSVTIDKSDNLQVINDAVSVRVARADGSVVEA